jgi:hypothetical protein
MRIHTQQKKLFVILLISLTTVSAPVQIVGAGHSERRSVGDLSTAGRVREASRHKAAPANASRARDFFPSSGSLFLPAVAYISGAGAAASVAVADVNGDVSRMFWSVARAEHWTYCWATVTEQFNQR